jgi:hypothetical protein
MKSSPLLQILMRCQRPNTGWFKTLFNKRDRIVFTDTTLPTGPVERTLEYQAPFTRQNRETDYATVWVNLGAQNVIHLP